jgi:AbrB family looped-hinge helix DNA binding protein
MMNTALVMSNGDLRLPKDIAERLNAKPGDAVGIEADADGTVRLYPKTFNPDEVFACLAGRTSVRATIEEMDESVAETFRKGEM